MRPLVNENLVGTGTLGFGLGDLDNIGDQAAKDVTTKIEADLKEGKLDVPGAADGAARTAATTAGAAGGAAACAAVGAAIASPLCATIGGEIAGRVYDVAKKFFGSLFGGESAAAKAQRKTRAAQSKKLSAEIEYNEYLAEVMGIVRAMMAQIKETNREIGVTIGQNAAVEMLSKYGVPIHPLMRLDPADIGRCIPNDAVFHDSLTGADAPGPQLTVSLPGGCAMYAWRNRQNKVRDAAMSKASSKAAKEGIRKKFFDEETKVYRAASAQLLPFIDLIRNATVLVLTDLTVRAEVAKAATKTRRAPPALRPVTPSKTPPKLSPVTPKTVAPKAPTAAASTAAQPAPGAYGPYPQAAAGVGAWSNDAWRWFTLHDRGTPLVQRGPIWLSDNASFQEEADLIESAQRHGRIASVARWDWDASARRWQQARG